MGRAACYICSLVRIQPIEVSDPPAARISDLARAGPPPGDYLTGLNPEQREAVEAIDGPVTVELGRDTLQADYRVVRSGRDDDWDRLYGVWRAYWPDAAEYEKKTDRKFPVALITVR